MMRCAAGSRVNIWLIRRRYWRSFFFVPQAGVSPMRQCGALFACTQLMSAFDPKRASTTVFRDHAGRGLNRAISNQSRRPSSRTDVRSKIILAALCLGSNGGGGCNHFCVSKSTKKFPRGTKFNALLLIYMTGYSRRKGAGWNIAGKAITGTGG